MAETIWWCRVHDGNPDDCERKIAWDESCDLVELIDPEKVDYEAAVDAAWDLGYSLDDVTAKRIVDAALGVGEPVEGSGE
jgi:hypothetical protein